MGIDAAPAELMPIGHFDILVDKEFHGKPFHDNEYANVFLLTRQVDVADLTLQAEELDDAAYYPLCDVLRACYAHEPWRCVPTAGVEVIAGHFGVTV